MHFFDKINKKISKIISFSMALLLLAMPIAFSKHASALEIKDTTMELRNDFILEPAKMEVVLDPGQSVTKQLSVVNRMEGDRTFKIEVEDFGGTTDPKTAVQLMGNEKGPYSLRDNIVPETDTFTLKQGQRALVDVRISAPQNAEPGGRYASVLVSTSSAGVGEGESGAKSISRIGALYFVKVNGPVNEDGKLTDFKMVGSKKPFYEKGPFDFEMLFENKGSIHLVPSGKVTIKNTLGKQVAELPVPAFFSLPESLRGVQITWDPDLAFGRYTANIELKRGYQENTDMTDAMSLSFWVLPWKVLVGFIVAIILVTFILRKLFRTFEFKRKDSGSQE